MLPARAGYSVVALASAVLGAGLVAAVVRSAPAAAAAPRETPPASHEDDRTATEQAPRASLDPSFALARRLEALEARLDGGAPSRQAAAPVATRPPITPAEGRAYHADQERAWMDRFAAEGTDPKWSARATGAFQRDLDGVRSELHGDVLGVECRTTLCAAHLRWASYDDAKQDAAELMTVPYQVNCARSVFTPPPDDPGQAYEATVRFDCENARVNE